MPLVVDGKITCFLAGVTVARPRERVDARFVRGGTYGVRLLDTYNHYTRHRHAAIKHCTRKLWSTLTVTH